MNIETYLKFEEDGLTEAVLRECGVDFEDLWKYPEDYCDASSGSLPGFIYYNDTVRFAKEHLVPIMNMLNEFENELGAPLDKPTESEIQFYNWMCWFAAECVMHKMCVRKGI